MLGRRVSAGPPTLVASAEPSFRYFDRYVETSVRGRGFAHTLIDPQEQSSCHGHVVFLACAHQERLRISVRTDSADQRTVAGILYGVLVDQVSPSTREPVRTKRPQGSRLSFVRCVRRISDFPGGREPQLRPSAHVDIRVHPDICPGHVDLVRLAAARIRGSRLCPDRWARTHHGRRTQQQRRKPNPCLALRNVHVPLGDPGFGALSLFLKNSCSKSGRKHSMLTHTKNHTTRASVRLRHWHRVGRAVAPDLGTPDILRVLEIPANPSVSFGPPTGSNDTSKLSGRYHSSRNTNVAVSGL